MKIYSVIKVSLVALVASSALLAGQLYATDTSPCGMMPHFGGKSGGMHRMLRKLDLTDAQNEDVRAIMEKYQADRPERLTKEQRVAHRADMLALISNVNFDETKANAILDQQQQKHRQQVIMHLKMQNEIYQLLTPEQQLKYQDRFVLSEGKETRR